MAHFSWIICTVFKRITHYSEREFHSSGCKNRSISYFFSSLPRVKTEIEKIRKNWSVSACKMCEWKRQKNKLCKRTEGLEGDRNTKTELYIFKFHETLGKNVHENVKKNFHETLGKNVYETLGKIFLFNSWHGFIYQRISFRKQK